MREFLLQLLQSETASHFPDLLPEQIVVVVELIDDVIFVPDHLIVLASLLITLSVHSVDLPHHFLHLLLQFCIFLCEHLLQLLVLFLFLLLLQAECGLKESTDIRGGSLMHLLLIPLCLDVLALVLHDLELLMQGYYGRLEVIDLDVPNRQPAALSSLLFKGLLGCCPVDP